MYNDLRIELIKQLCLSLKALVNYYEGKAHDRSYDNMFLTTMKLAIEEYMSSNPLSPEDIEQLKIALAQIPEMKKAIYDAKRAGIDTSEREKEISQYEQQIKQLLTVYDKK